MRLSLLLSMIILAGTNRVTDCLAPKLVEASLAANKTITLGDYIELMQSDKGIRFNMHNSQHVNVLTGVIGHNADTVGVNECQLGRAGTGLCIQWVLGPRLEVYEADVHSNANIRCVTVNWTLPAQADSAAETPEDCYSMEGYFWFGGFEEPTQNWPINDFYIGSVPFITSEGYLDMDYGEVLEGIFVSSSGAGIFVDETTPLYLSIDGTGSKLICLKGKVGADTPFFHRQRPHLLYDVCRSTDLTTLWKSMADRYIAKPQNYPSLDVIRYPIWSTWATFKGNINQTTVLEFAESIKGYNFSISQLEIDDNWTPRYGDFVFDTKTFKEAKTLISNLTKKGIHVTVWVHWFFNSDSDAFRELGGQGYLIKEYNSDSPLQVPWWRGDNAGVLDVTNPDAVRWYLNKLGDLKTIYNVTSFKFDAGEVKWIKDKRYKVKEDIPTPNYLTKRYAEAAFQADVIERRQEMRVAFRSQDSSNMVRMFDRNSDWSHYLGIKTLIPCALVFGLMGYPYVLPDLIGGNAYTTGGIDATALPEPELFIRWLQVSVFLPILQFSVVPWAYNNDSIIQITHKFVDLHERYADKIIGLVKNAQQTGQPIVRPLWWIAPTDKDALALDSEFLLGDDLLVAPVLEKGARSRDIYLPPGQWHDELRGATLIGGTWLKDYRAELDELPYFTKIG